MNRTTETIILSTVIPVLVVIAIIGILIWIYLCTQSRNVNFSRTSTRRMNATLADTQNKYSARVNYAAEQFSSSEALPTLQDNNPLYTQQHYENVMIEPISQADECATTSACVPEAASPKTGAMDFNDPIYENNPLSCDSSLYCNYRDLANFEEDDTYIIPSE